MSMAIKYAMKKKMAKGGDVKDDGSMTPGGVHRPVHGSSTKPEKTRGSGMSAAGEHVRSAHRLKNEPYEKHSYLKSQESAEKVAGSRTESAKNLHKEALGKLKSDKGDRTNLAEGGDVECMACKGGTCYEHGGMVDRIMRKRMSKGGEVANDTDMSADMEPNEFDDLVLDDDLEFHETGANSGDHLGNEEMDENDHDLISRIMRSRAKKDKMPRPA